MIREYKLDDGDIYNLHQLTLMLPNDIPKDDKIMKRIVKFIEKLIEESIEQELIIKRNGE